VPTLGGEHHKTWQLVELEVEFDQSTEELAQTLAEL